MANEFIIKNGFISQGNSTVTNDLAINGNVVIGTLSPVTGAYGSSSTKLTINNIFSGYSPTLDTTTTSYYLNYGLVGGKIELNAPNAADPIALDVKLNSSAYYGKGINVTSVVSGGYFNVNDIQLALSHIGYAKGIAIQGNAIQSGIEIGVSNSNRGLLIGMSNSTVASGEGSILIRRLRNSGTTTVSLLDGDELGTLDFAGKIKTSWSNSISHSDDFASGAYIKSFIEGAPSFNFTGGTIIPSNLKFYTNSGTLNSNPVERMVIKSNGNVGVGTLSPSESLEVSGKTKTVNLQITSGATSGYVLSSDSLGNATWIPGSSISGVIANVPQANKIYVDSLNGTDSTGRGKITSPYLTVEYALADITNTGTVTATTTSTSATLTAVSSTANIVVGQFITGTGIPYNTIVVSKTSNTIVLSKTCTASATVITTWWTPYLIILNGDFVATGNWQKQGFTFQCLNSTISWGAFNLFNLSTAQLVPFIVLGGNWNGTSSSSRFLSLTGPSSADFVFKPNTFYSIGTGYSIDSNQNGVYKFNNFTLECQDYICAFGSIASFESIGNVNVIGYFYSLLTGFLLRYCTFDVFGKIETPSSVNVINNTQGATITSNAIIKGSLASVYGVFNGNIYGTTLTNTGGSYATPATYNCGVTVTTFTNSGFAIINGQMLGSVVNNGTLGNIVINDMIGAYTGSNTSKGTVRASSDVGVTFQATLTGSAELTVLDTRYMINALTVYTIASGCTLYNKGYFRGYLGTMAGTLINEGNMTMIDTSIITGTFKNFNYINLTRSGTESASATPTISVSTGTLILNAGSQLECQLADSKSGLIRKTASGGKVIILGQPYLKVANGLAPLQILSNTGTAQDVLNFGVIDNCAVGFRLANTFSDTTYGTAYAPNILGGGTNYEDTTYSF